MKSEVLKANEKGDKMKVLYRYHGSIFWILAHNRIFFLAKTIALFHDLNPKLTDVCLQDLYSTIKCMWV